MQKSQNKSATYLKWFDNLKYANVYPKTVTEKNIVIEKLI